VSFIDTRLRQIILKAAHQRGAKFLPRGGEAAQEFSFVFGYAETGITRRRKFP
jgi:hypothetical protein